MKPMTLILIGALIAVFGGVLGAVGTFLHNKRSSEKSSRIETGVNQTIDLGKLNNDLSKLNVDLTTNNNLVAENILSLERANSELAQETKKISQENTKLAEQNVFIANENKSLANENRALSEKIFSLAKIIQNLNTGGAGYPDMRHPSVTLFEENFQLNGDHLHLILTFFNNGEYAFDNLKVKGYEMDFRNNDPIFLWTTLSSSGLNIHSRFPSIGIGYSSPYKLLIDYSIDVFKPLQAKTFAPITFKDPFEFFGVNIFVESKRQDWIILLRLHRPPNSTIPFASQAIRIMKVTGGGLSDVVQNVDLDYPVNDNGKIMWFKSDLPDTWFVENGRRY